MPTDVSMKICPGCRAPNPIRQTVCFACGRSLSKSTIASPKLSEPTYSCVNCQAIVPYSATACPSCGRLVSAAPSATVSVSMSASVALPGIVALGPAPRGWEIIPLPDGSTQLKRKTWKRLTSDVGLPAVCLLFGATLWFAASLGRGHAPVAPSALVIVMAGLFTLLGFVIGIWQIMSVETIRVGPNRFERRKSLIGYEQTWRFTDGAVLRAETRRGTDRSGGYTTQRLKIESLSQKMTLDATTHRDGLLSLFGSDTVLNDDIAALGHYLSGITGWPFVDAERGLF